MKNSQALRLVAVACGLGARIQGCSDGPQVLKQSAVFQELLDQQGWSWDQTIEPVDTSNIVHAVADVCLQLARITRQYTEEGTRFCVVGGDHAAAAGSWSGIAAAKAAEGPIGLMWFDAHMDSHTFATSESGALHGMSLACLLGHGEPQLTQIMSAEPKVKPEHVALIGVRSYESGEAALLADLNVRVFFMEEVLDRGLDAVMEEALKIVTTGTVGYGVSFDLDGIDPVEVPGVGSRANNGMSLADCARVLQAVAHDDRLLATEIMEFNPYRDEDDKSLLAIMTLLRSMYLGEV